ncbi:MAG: CRISPR-associated endonuclease Cas1 [Pseudomonadota bacterium]|nr:CRISPR-associated endonuclease Cas1 [Pseudomonadota bacterium]
MMGTLLIDRKNVELRKEGAHVLVYESGERTGSVPIRQIDRVVIHGRVLLDTSLLGALAGAGIGLVALNQRKPANTAHVQGNAGNDVRRRVGQYRLALDESWKARTADLAVRMKVRGQRRLLARARKTRPDQRLELTKALREIELRLAALAETGISRDTIRGIEGAAAASYFRGYSSLFPGSLNFTGRNRRPPRDPVNACLSLGYTLLHSEAVMALHGAGLDPMLGFYHDPAFGRESLASDVIEPLRPVVDAWVWSLFRDRELRGDHFRADGDACLLGKQGRTVFYARWQGPAGGLRHRLRAIARWLARRIEAAGGP